MSISQMEPGPKETQGAGFYQRFSVLLLWFKSLFPNFLWLKCVCFCGNFGPCGKPANNYVGTKMEDISRSKDFSQGVLSSTKNCTLGVRGLASPLPDSGSHHCPEVASVQHGCRLHARGLLTQSVRAGGRVGGSLAVASSRESPRTLVHCKWAALRMQCGPEGLRGLWEGWPPPPGSIALGSSRVVGITEPPAV